MRDFDGRGRLEGQEVYGNAVLSAQFCYTKTALKVYLKKSNISIMKWLPLRSGTRNGKV